MKKTVTTSVLKSMLNAGNVKFTYKKKNGEEREAIGTTNKQALDRIGVTVADAGSCTTSGEEEKSVRYYDVQKNAWRAFSLENNKTVVAEAI